MIRSKNIQITNEMHFNIIMYFIHNILANMFRPEYRSKYVVNVINK
jgi:hypothetical protein